MTLISFDYFCTPTVNKDLNKINKQIHAEDE